MTIYVLSLIEKVTKDRNNYIVDVKKNHKAYIEANRRLFDNKEEEAEKSYNGLKINRKTNKENWANAIATSSSHCRQPSRT